ncbi:Permease of the drug/metabolite transporter (DMT) superfamily [Caenispirillum salinarum AK4]|uniref:Permease of the drug/metabolite transporter (DMT) superfamily n=1 Tax=Caenispirillum salinarum AK4 TaxID=1238182 RepID=K9GSR4_9PROT|nr:DMT family transporter [Caenispirillum salinarum]EKV28177.1 Permease of the drug/metabolite transporter (DMT) superfamily [Caenispirillum salinarum AK4]
MPRRLIADLTLLLTAILWGSTFVVQKLAFVDDSGAVATGDDALGPLAFTGSRFILGALVILPLALRERARARVTTRRGDRLGFVLCGVLLFLGSYTQQVGIIHTSVTNAGFLTALYVPMVPVLALFLFRKLPHWAVWPGVVGCTAGTWFLNGGRLDGFSDGDLWVIGSALFWALHVIAVGAFVGRSDRPLGLACTQFFTVGILGMAGAWALETPSVAALTGAAFEIAYAGILSVGVAYTLQVVGQRGAHPADAALILSSEMVFAAIAAAIVLGERLTAEQMAGAGLILASILVVEALPFLHTKRRRRASASAS